MKISLPDQSSLEITLIEEKQKVKVSLSGQHPTNAKAWQVISGTITIQQWQELSTNINSQLSK